MLRIEHVLVAIKFLMANIIDDVPRWVKEAVAAEKAHGKSHRQRN